CLQTDHLRATAASLRRLFGGGGVYYGADLRDFVGGKAAGLCVLPYGVFVGSDVDAIDFVVGDIAVQPLDLRPHVAQDAAGCLGDSLQLFRRELAGSGDLSFDDELGHWVDLT